MGEYHAAGHKKLTLYDYAMIFLQETKDETGEFSGFKIILKLYWFQWKKKTLARVAQTNTQLESDTTQNWIQRADNQRA